MKFQGLGLLLVILTSCSADFIPFSGGALEGNLVTAPDDWTEVSAAEVIQLETNPKPFQTLRCCDLWATCAIPRRPSAGPS